MLRYHKGVYFPEEDKENLINFTNKLNTLTWGYSSHSLDNLKHRVIDTASLLNFIKVLTLSYDQIFEYYKTNLGAILKACYRIEYKNYDFILVLSADKNIVTIYVNSKNDKHETLNKSLYTSEESK